MFNKTMSEYFARLLYNSIKKNEKITDNEFNVLADQVEQEKLAPLFQEFAKKFPAEITKEEDKLNLTQKSQVQHLLKSLGLDLKIPPE